MENYANLTETFNKLDEFSFIRLLEEPKNIKQNLVIGYDGDFPFVIKNGQVFILEEKIERFVNTDLNSFLQFLLICQDYSEKIQAFSDNENEALQAINAYVKNFETVDKKALSIDDSYWMIVIQQMIDGNL